MRGTQAEEAGEHVRSARRDSINLDTPRVGRPDFAGTSALVNRAIEKPHGGLRAQAVQNSRLVAPREDELQGFSEAIDHTRDAVVLSGELSAAGQALSERRGLRLRVPDWLPFAADRGCAREPRLELCCLLAQAGPSARDDGVHCAATLRIVEHPGHYMNHEASNLLDPQSVDYWASLHRQVRDQAFVFEVDHEQVLGRVEWKDRGDRMGAARLSLEAQVGEAWQKLSTWDSVQTPRWQ
ncbi:unnamed protein product, partial [Prorocentrum cordatum]